MENQHTKITGYRDLSQGEVDLMNEIKAKGAELDAMVLKVGRHLTMQKAESMTSDLEAARLRQAEPVRWVAIARTDFQTGLAALTRAVAQPTSF